MQKLNERIKQVQRLKKKKQLIANDRLPLILAISK